MKNVKNQLVTFVKETQAKHGSQGVFYTRVSQSEKGYNVYFQSDLIIDGECWNVEGIDFKNLDLVSYVEVISLVTEIYKATGVKVENGGSYVNGLQFQTFKNGRLVA